MERVFKKHGIATASKPHTTLRNLLVKPKDKIEKENIAECVYQIPCHHCKSVYVGETSRKMGKRINEHKKEVETLESKKYTRAERKTSLTEFNKSAVTDHAHRHNHLIDWDNTRILDREGDTRTRQVKEAIWIRKNASVMNRDEGAYKLGTVYNQVLATKPPSGQRL